MWSFIKGVDLPGGKKEKIGDDDLGSNAVRNRIGASHREMGEQFSVVASERQPRCAWRARSQAVPSKRITISTPR